MQEEVEMLFGYILHENRSVLDLIDCDYTFVNDKLAKYYGLPEVTGNEMRRVELPKDSPRGGVLTQGSVLVVTSNPDRTSPVKRGLFILDNILGSRPRRRRATCRRWKNRRRTSRTTNRRCGNSGSTPQQGAVQLLPFTDGSAGPGF